MLISEQTSSYGAIAVVLHWLSAAAILTTIPLGFATALISLSSGHAGRYAKALASQISGHSGLTMPLIFAHVFLGISIFLLTMARLSWLLFDKRPNEPPGQPRWQSLAAHTVHWLLYGLLIILPLSGISLVVISGAIPVLMGEVLGPIPSFPKFWPSNIHSLAAFTLILLLIIHVGAALYHQYIRRDDLFARMGVKRKIIGS